MFNQHQSFRVIQAPSSKPFLIAAGLFFILLGMIILLMPQLLIALISGFFIFLGSSILLAGFRRPSRYHGDDTFVV